MTSLIIEARVTPHEVFYLSILGDDIFRTLERIESNQPYYTTLVHEQTICCASSYWIDDGLMLPGVKYCLQIGFKKTLIVIGLITSQGWT